MKYSIKRITTHIRERSEQRNLNITKDVLEAIINNGEIDSGTRTKQVHIYMRKTGTYVVVTNEGNNQYNAVTIMRINRGNTPKKQAALHNARLILL